MKNLGWGGMRQYHVYIMSSYRGTLYTGVTNDLARRAYDHQHKLAKGFTRKYKVSKLVYYEVGEDIAAAIAREKQIKGWTRNKKVAPIEAMNPQWTDLAQEWEHTPTSPDPSASLRVTQGSGTSA